MTYSPFNQYPLDGETAKRLEEVRDLYRKFVTDLEEIGGDHVPRLLALSKTSLEESAMWYIKSLAHACNPEATAYSPK